jgi:hypothetical protein
MSTEKKQTRVQVPRFESFHQEIEDPKAAGGKRYEISVINSECRAVMMPCTARVYAWAMTNHPDDKHHSSWILYLNDVGQVSHVQERSTRQSGSFAVAADGQTPARYVCVELLSDGQSVLADSQPQDAMVPVQESILDAITLCKEHILPGHVLATKVGKFMVAQRLDIPGKSTIHVDHTRAV